MNRLVLFGTIALLFNLGQCAPQSAKSSEAPARDEMLENNFKDIIELIPKQAIMNITRDHLESDEDFKAAIIYMQSKEWVDLTEAIREKPEWIELKKFLKDSGVDVDIGIRCIEGLLGTSNVTLNPQLPTPKKSLKYYLADVEQALPTMKILNALEDKMVKAINFKELFDKLSSEESHILVEKVFALPEVKQLLTELAEMGVDLSNLFTLMYTVFGWGEFKPFN